MAARINIEVDFFTDPRIEVLSEILGSKFEARGMFLTAIHVAQRYWAPKNQAEHKRLIPKDVWNGMNFSPIIKAGLAIEKDDGFYLKGSEERFEWLINAQLNGRKGGRPKTTQLSENIQNEESPPLATLKPPLSQSNHINIDTDININTNTRNTAVPNTDDLMNSWNENCGKLPKVIKLGSSRARQAKARLKENPSLDYWVDIIKRVSASDFCNGQNSRQWVANIDFLLRPDTQFKALEGSYDNKEKKIVPKIRPFGE